MFRKISRQTGKIGRLCGRSGGLCLESAIIMPIILLFIASMICFILSVEMEIKLKGALDRTASEISLLSPLCDLITQTDLQLAFMSLTDSEAGGQEIAAVLQEILPGQMLTQLISDGSFDLASSALMGPFIQQRVNYWLSEAQAGQPGWQIYLGNRRLYLDWRLDSQQLWLCMAYQINTPIGRFNRQANVVVPLWIGKGEQEDEADADQIWLMDNFSRGQGLRLEFGGNLPSDFPVIARFSGGEAVSIKSMDLTAPAYQQQDSYYDRVYRQINLLAAFSGTSYGKNNQMIEILPASITGRKLLLIIPGNCSQPWLDEINSRLCQDAARQSVSLEIEHYGNSTRYQ